MQDVHEHIEIPSCGMGHALHERLCIFDAFQSSHTPDLGPQRHETDATNGYVYILHDDCMRAPIDFPFPDPDLDRTLPQGACGCQSHSE